MKKAIKIAIIGLILLFAVPIAFALNAPIDTVNTHITWKNSILGTASINYNEALNIRVIAATFSPPLKISGRVIDEKGNTVYTYYDNFVVNKNGFNEVWGFRNHNNLGDYTSKAGAYSLIIAISDKAETKNFVVAVNVIGKQELPKNSPPYFIGKLQDKTVYVGDKVEYQLMAFDADNDKLSFFIDEPHFLVTSPNVAFDKNTGSFKWTPSEADVKSHEVIFGVSDGKSIATQTAKITVLKKNSAPLISNKDGIVSVNEGQSLSYQISATDLDNDKIEYGTVGLPQGAAINKDTGLLSYSPNFEAVKHPERSKDFEVSVFAFDGKEYSPRYDFILRVKDANQKPAISTAQKGYEVDENQELIFGININDKDSEDTLTLTTANPKFENNLNKISGNLWRFSWKPGFDEAGIYNLDLTVTDGIDSASLNIIINVINQNRAPVSKFTLTPESNIMVGDIVTFDASQSFDLDGDELEYKWDFGDGNTSTEKIAKHSFSKPNLYSVNLRVTEKNTKEKLWSLSMEAIEVKEKPVPKNSPPRFGELNAIYDVRVGEKITINITGFDDDINDKLALDAGAFNSNIKKIEDRKWIFEWTPNDKSIGINKVSLKLSDGKDSVEDKLYINVLSKIIVQANKAPYFENKVVSKVINELEQIDTYGFVVKATDEDTPQPTDIRHTMGDAKNNYLQYSLVETNIKEGTFGFGQVTGQPADTYFFSWIPTLKDGGNYFARFRVYDPLSNKEDFMTLNLEVKDFNILKVFYFLGLGDRTEVKDGDTIELFEEYSLNVVADVRDTKGNEILGDKLNPITVEIIAPEKTLIKNAGYGRLFQWTPGIDTVIGSEPFKLFENIKVKVNYQGVDFSRTFNIKIKNANPGVIKPTPKLEITKLELFNPVVQGHEQSISLEVKADGQKVDGANAAVFFENGSKFGECITGVNDRFNGGCAVRKVMEEKGHFRIFAVATKPGNIISDKKYAEFDVFEEGYIIEELYSYGDASYSARKDSFFRGENLYIKFRVKDKFTGSYVTDTIASAVLDNKFTGQKLYLQNDGLDGIFYRFKVQIPAEHRFKGETQVFTFAINFANKKGGEEVITITIKNNAVKIKPIPDLTCELGKICNYDLSQYASDNEDAKEFLKWGVAPNSDSIIKNLFNVSVISAGKIRIVPKNEGTGGLFVTVSDLDDDSSVRDVNVIIKKTVVQPAPTLQITSLECFDNVIAGERQSCSVKVQSNAQPIVGSYVELFFSDGVSFGQKGTTQPITGGYETKHTMTKEGTFTVYATANKAGFIGDNDKKPTFTFKVLKHRYDIANLKVYNDAGFTIEDYDFFRGENMYVQFKVKDLTNNQFVDDIVTKATLVSPPGGRVDLTKISSAGDITIELPISITVPIKQTGNDIFEGKISALEDSLQVIFDINNLKLTLTLKNGDSTSVPLIKESSNKYTAIIREEEGNIDFSIDTLNMQMSISLIKNKVDSGVGVHRYTLTPIPLSHDFKGDSQVFTFAFNFADGSGGQKEVNLVIRNNPPTISGIPDITCRIGETCQLPLIQYINDKEDAKNILALSVRGVNEVLFAASVINQNLIITPKNAGTDEVKISVADLDNDTASDNIFVTILPQIAIESQKAKLTFGVSSGSGTVAANYIEDGQSKTQSTSSQMSASVDRNTQVHLSASPSADYEFSSWNIGSTNSNIVFTITEDISVFASFGLASIPNNPPNADFIFNPLNPAAGQLVTFTSTSTDPDFGDSIASFAWDFNNDNIADATAAVASIAFNKAGAFPVKLTVTDTRGASNTIVKNVAVAPPQFAPEVNRRNDLLTILSIKLPKGVGSYSNDWLPVELTIKNYGNVDVNNAPVAVGFYDGYLDLQSTQRKINFNIGSGQSVTKRFYVEAPEFIDGGEYFLRVASRNSNSRGIIMVPVELE